uniref:inositol-tetrakisphosphate 1-kinase-like isoform X1 n=1 Tax=Styela clava TaxID=7725 RepID=UPI00193A398B|nr:inositol-tetrakisphosphate 1-kinase-like isoform X1 [Styela clava]
MRSRVSNMVPRRKFIGCWFSAKKKKKVNLEKLRAIVESHGAILKEIDFSKTMKAQEPFDAIIHKMTDRMIEAMSGNKRAEKNIKDVENYLENHPNTVVVDPLPSIRKLLDRHETYKLIKGTKLCLNVTLHIPTFAYITSRNEADILEQMRANNVEFPFVCKKSVAHGSASHKHNTRTSTSYRNQKFAEFSQYQDMNRQMSIIFNKEGLKDVDPPCVAQTFINHGALLYKIYVIADKYHVVQRPSLRDFSKDSLKDHKTIFFNSHDISSGDSSRSKLTTPDEEDVQIAPPLETSAIDAMTKELHNELHMTMYGVDIIASIETGKQYIIDVNVFPGYDGVPDFLDTLMNHVMKKLEPQTNGISARKQNGSAKTALIKPLMKTRSNNNDTNCHEEPPLKKSSRNGVISAKNKQAR